MTISRSMACIIFSAFSPERDIRLVRADLGTILIAAYWPVLACFAIFTWPAQFSVKTKKIKKIQVRTRRSFTDGPSDAPGPNQLRLALLFPFHSRRRHPTLCLSLSLCLHLCLLWYMCLGCG